MSDSNAVTGGASNEVESVGSLYNEHGGDRTPEEFIDDVFVIVPMLTVGADGGEPTEEEQQAHVIKYQEDTGDDRIAITQDQHDMLMEELEPLTNADGYIDVGDGDLEALLRSLFIETAQVSLNLLDQYAKQMSLSNSVVDQYTSQAEAAMSAANTVEGAGDTVELDANFDYKSASDVYEAADGQNVPEWVTSNLTGDGSIEPTKTELEALSRMYTNAANSEQSNGQMVMNALQTAQNRYDEAVRTQNSIESDRHDLAKLIAQS